MSRPEKEIFERLGSAGLAQVLDDVLDQNRIVRLANTCGLKYPGMRTRSQKRQQIRDDLIVKAGEQVTTRKAIFRAVNKETRPAARELLALPAEDREKLLKDDSHLLSNGRLGTYLFILAGADDDGSTADFENLLSRITPEPAAAGRRKSSTAPAKPSRDETRLKKQTTVLQKKVRHLEGQLLKSREAEKMAKRDLIQRKGELAESRMLTERLGHDLATTQTTLRQVYTDGKSGSASEKTLQQLNTAIRKLGTEQKKLARGLDKLATNSPVKLDADALAPLQKSLKELKKELAAIKPQATKKPQEPTERLEELHTDIKAIRKLLAKPPRRAPAKGASARVGVFIDVQNVFYGARRLKGRLDFDALMQAAVRDQRLIQATAYVVESKEIDQSSFIARLQHRAIEVRRKTLKVRADGSMKGDWDMELALDILDAAPQLDVVVLVSGDGDFTSLVKRTKRIGPRVEVIGFPRHTAKSLLEAADSFTPLDRKFMIYPSRAKAAEKAESTEASKTARRSSGGKAKPATNTESASDESVGS